MFEIYQETKFNSLIKILETKLLLTTENCLISNQGSSNRKLTNDPRISLKDKNFYKNFDEINGVYFRLKKVDEPYIFHYGGDVLIFLSSKILKKYNNVINTEENFGFMINKCGVEDESQFSGEIGMSFFNLNKIDKISNYKFDTKNSEIVVLNNIPVKYIKYIIINKKFSDFVRKNLILFHGYEIFLI